VVAVHKVEWNCPSAQVANPALKFPCAPDLGSGEHPARVKLRHWIANDGIWPNRIFHQQQASVRRVTRNGPYPTLVKIPRLLAVKRSGPTDLDLRYCTVCSS
jgi:hypothetical protein